MLNLMGKAELKACAPRIEFHGEERVKAVTIRLRGEMPVEVAEAGFVSQLSLLYDADGAPRITEFGDIPITRSVDNARAEIAGVVLERVKVDTVTLRIEKAGSVAYALTLKGEIEEGLDALHDELLTTVDVLVQEREAPRLAAVA
jgi:hypothetical protein